MISLCMSVHTDKEPFADEASAKTYCERTNTRQRQTRAVHRPGYGQRTDKALRTLNAYQCQGCSLWFVGAVKTGPTTSQAELQSTIDRHQKSHAERRKVLAATQFNAPRIGR